MEWEAEHDDGNSVDIVTLRCIGRCLPASVWSKLVHEAHRDEEWSEADQDRLAKTLLSCLQRNQSAASTTLQYIATSTVGPENSQKESKVICTPTRIYITLLEYALESFSKEVLEGLCSVLHASPITSLKSFEALYTPKRCVSALHLLQLGNQHQGRSALKVARSLLAGFCSVLEHSSRVREQEIDGKVSCLEKVQAAVANETLAHERRLLEKLQALLEVGGASRDEESSRIKHTQWDEVHKLSLFMEMIAASKEEPSSEWTIGSHSSTLPSVVQPETANLLHFLIDEYSSWQVKVDATKMLLDARLNYKPASGSGYEHFYIELFYGAASGCATIASTPTTLGGDEGYASLWRSALCGLVPSLIESIEQERIKRGDGKGSSTRQCVTNVVRALLSEPTNTLSGCEVSMASKEEKKKKKKGGAKSGEEDEADMMLDVFIGTDDGPPRHSVRAALLRSLEDKGMLHRQDWKDLTGIETVLDDWQDLSQTFLSELGDNAESSSSSIASNLVSLFEQKLQNEAQEESELLNRLTDDFASQQAFAQALVKIISECISAGELDTLTRVCKLLFTDLTFLDIILLYICPTQLLQPIAGLMDDQGLLQNGEEPSVIGTLLLFAQLLIQKGLSSNYNLEDLFPNDQTQFLACFVRSLPSVQLYSKLSPIEQEVVSNWITALFGSEGISDELIKSSSPQLMLRMAPTLFSQSIMACFNDMIDLDTLRGGLTYFLQDLLSYTLPSAITWLLSDLKRCFYEKTIPNLQDTASKARWAKAKMIRFEVLSMLLLSETCPTIVQSLIANKAVEVLNQFNSSDIDNQITRLKGELEEQVDSKKVTKTHLWIKTFQASMTSCNLDSLLNLDVSIRAVASKRGNRAAVQLSLDSLLIHPKSIHLSRAIAMSLCLASITKRSKTGLAGQLLLAFTDLTMRPQNSVKSVISTLHLVLKMLSFNSNADVLCCTDAVQALIALRLQRLVRKSKDRDEIGRLVRRYGLLFHDLSKRSILSDGFSDQALL